MISERNFSIPVEISVESTFVLVLSTLARKVKLIGWRRAWSGSADECSITRSPLVLRWLAFVYQTCWLFRLANRLFCKFYSGTVNVSLRTVDRLRSCFVSLFLTKQNQNVFCCCRLLKPVNNSKLLISNKKRNPNMLMLITVRPFINPTGINSIKLPQLRSHSARAFILFRLLPTQKTFFIAIDCGNRYTSRADNCKNHGQQLTIANESSPRGVYT